MDAGNDQSARVPQSGTIRLQFVSKMGIAPIFPTKSYTTNRVAEPSVILAELRADLLQKAEVGAAGKP